MTEPIVRAVTAANGAFPSERQMAITVRDEKGHQAVASLGWAIQEAVRRAREDGNDRASV